MNLPGEVVIKEVGPRDGLQNEKLLVPTEHKISWINQLSSTGLTYIEFSAFVSPKWIPALADAAAVAKGIDHVQGVTYAALVPNQRGLERALEASVDEVSVFLSASETHNRKNINKSIDETFQVLADVASGAKTAGKTVRGYVSTVFGCPFEGNIKLEEVIRVIESLLEIGISEVSLGDTIGVANPRQVAETLDVLLKRYPSESLALHFHDTGGMALANILVALEMGIKTFDASVGGLGGCPYAPGAAGNVATDDLINMLHAMDIHTGVDAPKLISSARFIQEKLGKKLTSRKLQACQT
ncbi:hydroxymethylglutaryl-CoA lyase [Paenibacillus prosopidis]|uniref:Hydroxymethylglutaryl-CoA lyase n=1 Tax=Paenibacillus prosopidis TaxID=630520 RepID=A0A368VQX1_9BACL|nr:hydroxymethylglutaryl-CoA lyase [Paenibacillus prosopidis]RCW42356.1 hydroxymethylglutaryl-CoA lyase [Paenibacillus prosopidis]